MGYKRLCLGNLRLRVCYSLQSKAEMGDVAKQINSNLAVRNLTVKRRNIGLPIKNPPF